MSSVSYNDILLNLNSRSLQINETKYKEVEKELESRISHTNDSVEKDLLQYDLNILNKQFNHYKRTLNLPRSSASRRRKETIGTIVDDRHYSLILNRLATNVEAHIFSLDLKDSLDVAMSVAFDIPLEESRKGLYYICDKYGVDYRTLSRSFMCQDDLFSHDCNFPFREFIDTFIEVKMFIHGICKNKIENDVNLLDSVSSLRYSNIINCTDELDQLVTAFNLKLLLAATDVLQEGIVKFERYRRSNGIFGGVLSQYISGFIIHTREPIQFDFNYQTQKETLFFPVM